MMMNLCIIVVQYDLESKANHLHHILIVLYCHLGPRRFVN